MPDLRVKRHLQGGYITVADQKFWMPACRGVVDVCEDTEGAIAAPGAEDRVDFGVGERFVEFGQSLRVGTGQIRMWQLHLAHGLDRKAGLSQLSQARREPVGISDRTAGRDDANRA